MLIEFAMESRRPHIAYGSSGKWHLDIDTNRYTLYYLFGLIIHISTIALLFRFDWLRDYAGLFAFSSFFAWIVFMVRFNAYQMR
ncbi:MAG: hypothetical protein ACXAD7_12030 [Candidatus Kariarchaeaceae archaeon]